ncbi:MAG TPA: DUF4446 family protein [Candidatus Blautia stercoravium]|nr:DUF4446 family protein [Candidatus Blautia stercoravium]
MEKFVSSLQAYSGILLLMLLIVVVILLVCVFNLSLGLNRLSRKYAIFMKGKDAQSLEKLFKRKFELIEKLTVNSEINAENIAKVEKMQNMILDKYGIVKYDAFEDMGGKLSFVLAMLDNNNTGFLLNAIHSRENCFLYIKEIVNGESYVSLSEEEIQALKKAVNFGIEESEFDI